MFGKQGFLKKKSRVASEEMSLQITSMADVFTIILVFLLKSFSTGAVNLAPTQGTMLPEARAGEAVVDALKLEVSKGAIQVEGQPVAELDGFELKPSDRLGNGASKSLSAALEKERRRQLLIAKNNSDVKVDSRIVVLADQKVPYSTLKAVLASAAVHGYTDFKLAVIREEP